MIAIFAKISEREITSAKLPTVSVVVNFVINIQNIYPATMEDRNCRYRYIAPLPTAGLNNFYHILGFSSINKILLISNYLGRHFSIRSHYALIITCHINEIHNCVVVYM